MVVCGSVSFAYQIFFLEKLYLRDVLHKCLELRLGSTDFPRLPTVLQSHGVSYPGEQFDHWCQNLGNCSAWLTDWQLLVAEVHWLGPSVPRPPAVPFVEKEVHSSNHDNTEGRSTAGRAVIGGVVDAHTEAARLR